MSVTLASSGAGVNRGASSNDLIWEKKPARQAGISSPELNGQFHNRRTIGLEQVDHEGSKRKLNGNDIIAARNCGQSVPSFVCGCNKRNIGIYGIISSFGQLNGTW